MQAQRKCAADWKLAVAATHTPAPSTPFCRELGGQLQHMAADTMEFGSGTLHDLEDAVGAALGSLLHEAPGWPIRRWPIYVFTGAGSSVQLCL